ncbi:hypothetical protein MUK70_10800 [Dyadobacter chenwenxiniae]|uniref:YbbR-like protein n=1 Tax=Dyadobacter chenwenxiniae TaxID=2906456 RepID=A0A9X1THX2_9BACT|nr:hypothetical protein [Dyadobacter chenwenxiniae]MCF0065562.1 hypothetical protein [Dyadobacter chenwenxiniae]UON85473.1 hypothetical protein MUK70_10800 [Dyadobacter chenwenxiniae]
MKNFISLLIPLCLSLGAIAQVHTFPFKSSSARQINISLNNSDVEIIGTNEDSVTITASNFVEADKNLLGESGTGLNVEVSENLLDIKKMSEAAASYVIRVPKTCSLSFQEEFRAPKLIRISNISGSVVAKSWVSRIILMEIAGPVQASSMASDVSVEYSSLSQIKPSTIESAGRLVEVILPHDSKVTANLIVTAGNVESEFDLGFQNRELLKQVGGTRKIEAKLNGGGPPLNISAHTIIIKKTK